MRTRVIPMLVCLMLLACKNTDEKAMFVLSANGLLPDSVGYYESGTNGAGNGFYTKEELLFPPFLLAHSSSEWGFGYGFTYCHTKDSSTPGYANLSSVTGRGVSGDTYFTVRTDGGRYGHPSVVTFQNGESYNACEVFVTNAVNAWLAMRDGDDGFGEFSFCKKDWGASDYLDLLITGHYDQYITGSVKVRLADGLNFEKEWRRVDLSPLGEVKSIEFLLQSSDSTETGVMNTPAYFCLDALTVSEL